MMCKKNNSLATNQGVVAAQRQQRGLVVVTIRGSVLIYSSAIWRPDFYYVKTEFRYLYGVDSIELRTLFYIWKMCRDHHWHWKNTKSKSESRRCQFCWYLTCILTIRLGDFFRSPRAWTFTIALSSKRLCDPMTWRHNSYNVTSRHDNNLSKTPTATCIVAPLSISNDIVSTTIYDKRDDFDFEIVNFPFLDGDVPRSTSYGVYISQLIRFARASSYVADFNTRNKLFTQKLLKQGYRYHKLRNTFSKFYRRYSNYDLISKFQVGLKSLLRQGLSEPDFYGDLVYKLKKIVCSINFSAQFIKIIFNYKKIGYNINVLQQIACLVVNPITFGNFAFLFNCTPVGRTSDSMMVPT